MRLCPGKCEVVFGCLGFLRRWGSERELRIACLLFASWEKIHGEN